MGANIDTYFGSSHTEITRNLGKQWIELLKLNVLVACLCIPVFLKFAYDKQPNAGDKNSFPPDIFSLVSFFLFLCQKRYINLHFKLER